MVGVRPKRKPTIDGRMCIWKRNDAGGRRKEMIETSSVHTRNLTVSTGIYSQVVARKQ
jgi:hypothetical protein